MIELEYARLRAVAAESRYPLIFASVSGAHLYGFPSRDSDVDIRGVHLLPAAEVVGLKVGPDTIDRMWTAEGTEFDLVTGILAMRTGQVEADLRKLGGPSYLGELIEAKTAGEHVQWTGVPMAELTADVAGLHEELDRAQEASVLPEQASAGAALHDLVVRARLG